MSSRSLVLCLIAVLGILAIFEWQMNTMKDQKATVAALQATGPFGDQFEVTLPNGKVAVAGTIVSADEAKEFYYEREIKDLAEYDVVYRVDLTITPSFKYEVMRRMHISNKK